MAFYPRVRAAKQTPSMKAYGKEAKALSFLAYKVGMTQVLGKNSHKGSPSFGQDVAMPVTVIAVPSLKVFGVRAYTKGDIGVQVLSDAFADNIDSSIQRKMLNFKKENSGLVTVSSSRSSSIFICLCLIRCFSSSDKRCLVDLRQIFIKTKTIPKRKSIIKYEASFIFYHHFVIKISVNYSLVLSIGRGQSKSK